MPIPPTGSREALVHIALEMLGEVEPDRLSIREAARRAGLTSGAPYHHFQDKTGLLAACAEVAWAELSDRLGRDPEPEASADPVVTKARVYIDYAFAHPGRYRLMVSRRWDDDTRFDRVRELRNLAMRRVVETVVASTGAEPGVAKQRAMALWALLHGHVGLVLEGAIAPAAAPVLSEQVCALAGMLARGPLESRTGE